MRTFLVPLIFMLCCVCYGAYLTLWSLSVLPPMFLKVLLVMAGVFSMVLIATGIHSYRDKRPEPTTPIGKILSSEEIAEGVQALATYHHLKHTKRD